MIIIYSTANLFAEDTSSAGYEVSEYKMIIISKTNL